MYYSTMFFIKLLMLFPKNFRTFFYKSVATLAYPLLIKQRKIIKANLDYTFGDELSSDEKEKISKQCFLNLITNFIQIVESHYMSINELKEMVTIKNQDIVKKIKNDNRAIIFVTAHFGNWEMGGASIGAFVEPSLVVFKELNNKKLSLFMSKAREKFKNKIVEKQKAIRAINKELKEGRTISLLIDQAVRENAGIEVDFFNHKTYFIPTTAQLALKHNAAIIPVYIKNIDENRFELEFFDEVKIEPSGDKKVDIKNLTQLQANILEDVIRKNPDHWFWCHKRFKYSEPSIYK